MNTSLRAAQIGLRGKEIYEASIRSGVEKAENIGKYVTIDIDSGEYVLDTEVDEARSELVRRKPHAVIYLIKVGYLATAVIGGRLLPDSARRTQRATK